MLRPRSFLCAVLASVALLGSATAGTGTAAASQTQTTFFEAPNELLNPATRPHAISQLKELGVNAIRLELGWAYVTPGADAKTRPPFEARNPASYAWGQWEAVIDEAHKLGWKVLLTVGGPAPRWATSNKTAPYVTRPNDTAYEEFMTAVGRKFGSDVTLFAIWNEPNEDGELRPQFNAKGLPESGRIYRGLFEAGYRGLQKASIDKPKVLMGETSPGGFAKRSKGVPSYAGVAPIVFLRDALCLNERYVREKSCKSLPASGYSQHPYALDNQGPFDRPAQPEDVTIGTVGRLVAALNDAARAGAIPSGLGVYLTEFGVMSRPNTSADAVSVETQADYDAIAERVAWENPRVAAFTQYLLQDDAPSKGGPSFQTGIEYANGAKKPLYYSFPIPLTVTTNASNGYNLWGYVRPSKKITTVTVLIERQKTKSFTVLQKVKTGPLGYWTLKSTVTGSYWKVRWTSSNGKQYEGAQIKAYPAP